MAAFLSSRRRQATDSGRHHVIASSPRRARQRHVETAGTGRSNKGKGGGNRRGLGVSVEAIRRAVQRAASAGLQEHRASRASASAGRECRGLGETERLVGRRFDDPSPSLPLHLRKNNLARLLARRPEGIFVSDFEQGEIGPDLFRAACQIGLEGMVSKRRDSTYCAGRSPSWIKVKNRKPPAMNRPEDMFG